MDMTVLRLAIAAIDAGAKLFSIGEDFYAAKEDAGTWTVWKLKLDSPEYYVTGDSCSCPSRKRPCKHLLAIIELF